MELDLGKITQRLLSELEEETRKAEVRKEQLTHIVTGVKLLYASIEAEVKRIQSEGQEKDSRKEETDHISI